MSTIFKYELLDLSNTHNAIADWLIANPGKGQLGRAAAHFGYTRAWLSTLIHQDAFQAMLKHKQGKTFEQVIIPLQEKIAGLAHAGVEKLGEIVDKTNDERLIREITRDAVQSLGYGASTAPAINIDNSTHNILNVDSAALAEARKRRSQHHGAAIESSSQPPQPSPENQAALVSLDQETQLGETRDIRSEHVHSSPPVYGNSEGGGKV